VAKIGDQQARHKIPSLAMINAAYPDRNSLPMPKRVCESQSLKEYLRQKKSSKNNSTASSEKQRHLLIYILGT